MFSRIRLSSVSALALAAGLALPSLASADTIYGLTADGDALVTFDSATPGTFTAEVPVTGLGDGTTLLAIDVRPSTRVIYGLGDDSRLYTITEAGVATAVGAPFTPALDYDAHVGFDFNNVSEGIRIATDTRQNLRLAVATGAATADTTFAYANGGLALLRAGSAIELTGVAYSPVVANATTLFGIDSNNRELVTITSSQDPATPDLFQVTPVPAPLAGVIGGNTLGIDPTDGAVGFDISPTGVAYVNASDDGDAAALYTVALTGEPAVIGRVTKVADLSDELRDIAVKIVASEPTDGGTDGGGDDGGSTSSSSSGGSSGASSSSGGSSGASSGGSSGGSSGASGTSGTSGTSGASGTSGTSGADGGVDQGLGIDSLEGGGCVTAATTEGSPWSALACTAALGLALAGMRRRNRR